MSILTMKVREQQSYIDNTSTNLLSVLDVNTEHESTKVTFLYRQHVHYDTEIVLLLSTFVLSPLQL